MCVAVCNLFKVVQGFFLFCACDRSACCVISLSSLQLLTCSVYSGENKGKRKGQLELQQHCLVDGV